MQKKDVEIWQKSFSILGQIFVPVIASSFIIDPIYAQGASTFALQMLSLAQSEVKQKRVESLMFGLEDLLKKHDENFKFEKANVQEVRDLLETAIINASRASSETKIDRLRKVLFGHIIDPQPIDYTSRFLDLAVRLNDDQVKILNVYFDTEYQLAPLREELANIGEILKKSEKVELKIVNPNLGASIKQKEIFLKKKKETEKRQDDLQLEYENIINTRRRYNSKYDPDTFQFLFNDMRVLGIVYNPAEGRISNTGDSSYYHCTALGKGFVKYLKEEV
ncbi:hypothetical protein [Flagellimonas hadalis]|uniref:Uncharacterized protein n=1 Tax=Flagellimonas hadalis TaxID=2597517 RepID=A0A5N5J6V0_9FLAO|nr:hypothetical protein [Allomuricauda hadalis]KAB5491800.1 hypothetical protein FOT42_002275 [Allomuricauda hadalis]